MHGTNKHRPRLPWPWRHGGSVLYLLMGAGAMYVPTVSYTDGREESDTCNAYHAHVHLQGAASCILAPPLFKATHATVPYSTLKRIHTTQPSIRMQERKNGGQTIKRQRQRGCFHHAPTPIKISCALLSGPPIDPPRSLSTGRSAGPGSRGGLLMLAAPNSYS